MGPKNGNRPFSAFSAKAYRGYLVHAYGLESLRLCVTACLDRKGAESYGSSRTKGLTYVLSQRHSSSITSAASSINSTSSVHATPAAHPPTLLVYDTRRVCTSECDPVSSTYQVIYTTVSVKSQFGQIIYTQIMIYQVYIYVEDLSRGTI